jgi:hypothetical protein
LPAELCFPQSTSEATDDMRIRDRIKELRRVSAKELLPNPKNWRVHPPAQKDALQGLLAGLGYCDDAPLPPFPSDYTMAVKNAIRRTDTKRPDKR